MATNISALERQWFMEKTTGFTAQTPLNQMKKVYFLAELNVDPANYTSMVVLEDMWLRQVIVDNGDTPAEGDGTSALWQQAVASIGATPSIYINENKSRYYQNV